MDSATGVFTRPRSVAQALRHAAFRPGDVVARYGGEEFALLLPKTSRAGARHLAQRVLDSIHAMQIPHVLCPTGRHVSASIGICSYDPDSPSWADRSLDTRFGSVMPVTEKDLLQRADMALYAAKKAGRARAYMLEISGADGADEAVEVALPGRSTTKESTE